MGFQKVGGEGKEERNEEKEKEGGGKVGEIYIT